MKPMNRKEAERFANSITGITRSVSGTDPLGGRDAAALRQWQRHRESGGRQSVAANGGK